VGNLSQIFLSEMIVQFYPGAPRYYRHGIHRGFDFSDREDGSIAGFK